MLNGVNSANENFDQFKLKFLPDHAIQESTENQQESDRLNTENETLKNQLNELRSESLKIKSMGAPATVAIEEKDKKIKEMEDELNKLREMNTVNSNIDTKRGRLEELTEQIKIKEEEHALKSAVRDLKSKYNASTTEFRKKAHEVLPFIEMLNASANINTINLEFFEYSETQKEGLDNIRNIFDLIKKRLNEQNYEVDDISLAQAVFFQCESRFLCFYGAPGTGKTSFARALSNAITGGQGNVLFQGVEKGWSTSEDLIGHKNPFVNQFIYKDDFFKKLYFHSTEEKPLNWLSIICDEGNLSPVEQYLAFLIGRDEEFNDRKDFSTQID